MSDPTLELLSRYARPGTPLHRIMQRRIAGAAASGYMQPGAYGSTAMASAPSQAGRYTGVGAVGGGGSNTGVQRGDFQMGGFPAGGSLHLSPTTRLSPGLRFGRAVSTVNGYPLTHPSLPGAIASATRLRGTGRADNVGQRGPY